MRDYKIFIGNIRKCTKYEERSVFKSKLCMGDTLLMADSFGYVETEDELYKENAVLVQFGDSGYVDIDNLNTFLDYFKVYKDIRPDGCVLGGLVMSTSAWESGCLFVEPEPKLYYDSKTSKVKKSVRQMKKQMGKQERR